MTTYTSISRLPIMTPGDVSVRNSWGTILNAALPLIEQTAAGIAVVDLTGLTSYTLTTANDAPDQARMAMLQFVGTPTAAVAVTIPAIARIGWVSNATTQIVTLKCGAGGTQLAVPALASYLYTCDATNVTAVTLAAPQSLSAAQGVTIGNNRTYAATDTTGAVAGLLGVDATNWTNLHAATTTGLRLQTSAGATGLSMSAAGVVSVPLGLTATGATTLSGTVGIAGAATLASSLSVAGLTTLTGGVTVPSAITSTGYDAGGLNQRYVVGSYGCGWRTDGSNFYLLLSAAGAQYSTFNSLRPFYVNLSTGAVALDATGAGVSMFGSLVVGVNATINGTATVGALRGGAVSGTTGSFTGTVTAAAVQTTGALGGASCVVGGTVSGAAGTFTSLAVNGTAYSTGGLQSYGYDPGAMHMRCINGATFGGFRNDGSNFYLLVSPTTGTGGYSATLPMHVNLATSQVTLGTSGQQTNVTGPLRLTGTLTASGGASTGFSGYAYTSGGPGAGSGSIGASIVATNGIVAFGFYTTSDRRSKSDIATIPWTDANRWVSCARPCTFTLDGAPSAGFLAQEDLQAGRGAAVQAILDEDPTYADSDGVAPDGHRLIRDYQHDIAYLTACLQGLLQRVGDLEAKREAA